MLQWSQEENPKEGREKKHKNVKWLVLAV